MTLNIILYDDNETDPKAATNEIEQCIEKRKYLAGLADKNNPRYEKCAHCTGIGLYIINKEMHHCNIFELIYESEFVCISSAKTCRYSFVH
ncbi:hypothetical protein KY312_00995 [Candidatus Woesearchaeota archaeon]|nr:hypothetical protein [Candidatus Woesearchaeota archaeon]